VLTKLVNGGEVSAVAWSAIHEFLAIVTHPRIYDPPTPRPVAFGAIKAWMQLPRLTLLHAGPGYLEKLERLCAVARISGPRIHDARIAALCLNHGVAELWTADRDFTAFPGLRTRNPLLSAG